MLMRNTEDESTVESVLNALETLIDKTKTNEIEFDALEGFINDNYKAHRYSEDLVKKAIHLATSLAVHDE
jgi:hypothetical protein